MQTKILFDVTPVLTTWSDAFEEWLKLDGRKSSMKPLREKSIEAVLQDVRHFSRFLEQYAPDEQPCAPTPQAVKAYFDWQANGAAPASVNRRLASLRTMMRWSLSVGLIEQDPTARIPRIEMSRLPPRAKDEQECRSLAKAVKAGKHLKCGTEAHRTLGLRDRVIWSMLYDAGLRRAEVAGLRVQDVHLGEHPYLQFVGKGGKVGQVAIKRSVAKLLAAWLKVRPGPEDGALITDWHGQGIMPGQVWRRFELICAVAGVTATPHDLRHTFVYRTVEEAMSKGATRAVAVGIACSQARHSDSRITEMYLRPTSEFIYQVVEGM
jgi:site-specific recombinase XerD